jgi:hypothetical protein
MYDSQRQEPCGFSVTSDGSTRCLPAGATGSYGTLYGDDVCAKQLAYWHTSQCNTAVPSYYSSYGASAPEVTCSPYVYRIYQIGAKIAPVSVYSIVGGVCIKEVPDAAQEYHLLGPEIPPSAFVAATIVTDP